MYRSSIATGQVLETVRAISSSLPCLSWSVLLSTMLTLSISDVSVQLQGFRFTSSLEILRMPASKQ